MGDGIGNGDRVRWWTSLVLTCMACRPGMGVGDRDGKVGGVVG
jgi:hypothetical protein